ncbi:hypothetical protein AVEN_117999-1 [Araneus ventricosus]|uniref:Uncharacterized protein n=1 Tax=Araneus ventricosus TaxID=182803 RepID=A0A4Y2CAD5_ARAVE|nr:hypothetical protein AVEN_117999-1 [Araneus ventricosus]
MLRRQFIYTPFHPFVPTLLFCSTHSRGKIRHVIHLKLQSALTVGESDALSLSIAALRSPPFLPLSGFPIKVASSRGPNLVKSFDVPTTLAKVPS